MKKLAFFTALLPMANCVALGSWESANSRGLVPYWQATMDWYTMLVFVNGSEDSYDTFYVRFCDRHGNFCSDTHADTFGIRPGEQVLVSTMVGVGYPMMVTTTFGYVEFRIQDGGYVHVYCVIANLLSGSGFVTPTYYKEHGF